MKFAEVKILRPEVHTDYRGDLWTTWKQGELPLNFNHDKVSTSRQNVLRGIHGDFKSWKLVSCLYGEIYFVVVDNRKDSDTYLQWDFTVLNDKSREMVLVPPGFGNGFVVLSRDSVFHYKWSYEGNYPDVDDQFTLFWNDPKIKINWPIESPILSQRDKRC
tara:strand:- start:694 stop:1176 length:483 start_codon:yes stop_codon:yes gene_type:complete